MTKDEAIAMLIENDLDTNELVESLREMAAALLRNGCEGYANMTDEDLAGEFFNRFGEDYTKK